MDVKKVITVKREDRGYRTIMAKRFVENMMGDG